MSNVDLNTSTVSSSHALGLVGSIPDASVANLSSYDKTPVFATRLPLHSTDVNTEQLTNTFKLDKSLPLNQTFSVISYFPESMLKRRKNATAVSHVKIYYPDGTLVPETVIKPISATFSTGLDFASTPIPGIDQKYIYVTLANTNPNAVRYINTGIRHYLGVIGNDQDATQVINFSNPQLKLGGIFEHIFQTVGSLADTALTDCVSSILGTAGKWDPTSPTTNPQVDDRLHAIVASNNGAIGIPFPSVKTMNNMKPILLTAFAPSTVTSNGFSFDNGQSIVDANVPFSYSHSSGNDNIVFTTSIPGQTIKPGDTLTISAVQTAGRELDTHGGIVRSGNFYNGFFDTNVFTPLYNPSVSSVGSIVLTPKNPINSFSLNFLAQAFVHPDIVPATPDGCKSMNMSIVWWSPFEDPSI